MLAAAQAAGGAMAQTPPREPVVRVSAAVDDQARRVLGRVRLQPPSLDTARTVSLDPGSSRIVQVASRGVPVHWAERGDGSGLVDVRLPPGSNPVEPPALDIDWETTPSTAAAGARHVELFSWYPLLAGTPRVTTVLELDVAADQVLAASGLVACGDPGWQAARRPVGHPVWPPGGTHAGAADSADAGLCEGASSGRRRIVWRSEDTPDIAVTMDPAYRYEEGDYREGPVRLLYLPGDERTWGAALASRRTETALAWLDELLDDYPWPQTTIVHGTGVGASAPMLVAPATPDQRTVLHMLAHAYLDAVPSNRPPWFDEGLARFVTTGLFEIAGLRGDYERLERSVLVSDLDCRSRPLAHERRSPHRGAEPDSAAWQRAELLFHQLRTLLGGDAAMKRALRSFYQQAKLGLGDEYALTDTAHAITGPAADTLMRQWIADTVLYDYALRGIWRSPATDSIGGWETTVDVVRRQRGVFPVEVWVFAEGDTAVARAGGLAPRQRLVIRTRTRPHRVRLDPGTHSHDWNMLNNQQTFAFRPERLLTLRDVPATHVLDTYFTRPSRRDALAVGWAPTAWLNDAGGWTFGLRRREGYLDRFDLHEIWLSMSTGASSDAKRRDLDARLTMRNPVWLRREGFTEQLDVASFEGRAGAAVEIEHESHGAGPTLGLALSWLTVRDAAYLNAARYDDAGTVELRGTARVTRGDAMWHSTLRATVTGGWQYPNAPTGVALKPSPYLRAGASITAGGEPSAGVHVGVRASASLAAADGALARQRRIYLAGADPYEQLRSPFLRSRGALLARAWMHYDDPGGAGVRGLEADLAARRAFAATVEVEHDLVRRPPGLVQRLALGMFADGALADGDLDRTGRNRLTPVADAGVGLRIDHRIGATRFQTRYDLPFLVSEPALARGGHRSQLTFRWIFSFTPAL